MGSQLPHFRFSGGCFHQKRKRTKFRIKVIKDDQPQGTGKLEITNEDMHNKHAHAQQTLGQDHLAGSQHPSIRNSGGILSFETVLRCETGPEFYQFPCKHADHVFLVVREPVEVVAAKNLGLGNLT